MGSCLARAGDREIFHKPASGVILSWEDWGVLTLHDHRCVGDMRGGNLMEGRMNLESMEGQVGEVGVHEVRDHSSRSLLFPPLLMLSSG